MRTPVKMGGFLVGLAAVFTAALGLGRVAGPGPAAPADDPGHGGHPAAAGAPAPPGAAIPAGLQVAQDGYRLAPVTPALSTGRPADFRFRIVGPDATPVTRYTRSHGKDLHLIVVRRDLSGFQHVHPTMAADGVWSIPLAVRAAGQYRVFADFQPAGHPQPLTLGVDVAAPGDYRPVPVPAASRTASVDGYTVTLDGVLTPGTASKLTLTVTRGGAPVTDLQPYLGAYGHLVALRDGDLAYLHVHPDGTPGDGRTASGPGVSFSADVPTAGTYRLYLDFQHAGRVRTAEFTAVAGTAPTNPPTTPAAPPAQPAPSSPGHDDTDHTHG